MQTTKVSVGVAAPRSTSKKLRFTHLTTSGFNRLQPLMYRPLIPGEKINGQGNFYVRSDSMINPVMTPIKFMVHDFFVRYKDVWPAWDDFDNKSQHFHPGDPVPRFVPNAPYCTWGYFTNYFINQSSWCAVAESDDDNPDIVVRVESASGVSLARYKLTNQGASVVKLLNSLGYRPLWDVSSTKKFNLLNLFCYFKAFIDWYFPAQYSQSNTQYRLITAIFATDTPIVYANPSSTGNLVYWNGLFAGLNLCTSTFFAGDDYYNVWQYPSAPNENVQLALQIPDITNAYPFPSSSASGASSVTSQGVSTRENVNGTPATYASATTSQGSDNNYSYVFRLNQYLVDSLKRLSDMVRRFQLVGFRAVDRFLVRYGIQLEDTHRAMLISSQEIPLVVGDVESNADSSNGTTSSNLGDLAGKGVSLKDLNIKCNAGSHAGLYLKLLSTIGDSFLVQGIDPLTENVDSLDFYNPEFDGLGVEAVPQAAVYRGNNGNFAHEYANGVLGYFPRYYGYAIDRHLVSGAFNIPSQGSRELASFHTFRWWSPNLSLSLYDNPFVMSLDFLRSSSQDYESQNRVFYNANFEEHFRIRFYGNFVSNSCKKPLKEVYDFDEDVRDIDVDFNGSKVN